MSKIALSGNASGTGTLTIAAPNTNSDRTIDLPDAAGTVFVSGQAVTATTGNFSGNVTLGSSVLETPSGSAPSYLCRAWVNFNGTGTVAIRGSGNVSSITDVGPGNYNINFTTAMSDANYAVIAQMYFTNGAGGMATIVSSPVNTTQANIVIAIQDTSSGIDSSGVQVAIFR